MHKTELLKRPITLYSLSPKNPRKQIGLCPFYAKGKPEKWAGIKEFLEESSSLLIKKKKCALKNKVTVRSCRKVLESVQGEEKGCGSRLAGQTASLLSPLPPRGIRGPGRMESPALPLPSAPPVCRELRPRPRHRVPSCALLGNKSNSNELRADESLIAGEKQN